MYDTQYTSKTTNEIINGWNLGVNMWLKHYIFWRINPSVFPKSMQHIVGSGFTARAFITRVFSALWHV